MTTGIALLAIAVVASVFILSRIRIVRDIERLAMIRGGEFLALRGPGLILAMPGPGVRYHRIRYRAGGIILSDERVEVSGVSLPYEALEPQGAGDKVRVVGFAPYRVHVEPDPS